MQEIVFHGAVVLLLGVAKSPIVAQGQGVAAEPAQGLGAAISNDILQFFPLYRLQTDTCGMRVERFF